MKAVARHAPYPAASALSALGRSVRAHRRQNLTLLDRPDTTNTTPPRGYPSRRADRPFVFPVFANAARITGPPRQFLLAAPV